MRTRSKPAAFTSENNSGVAGGLFQYVSYALGSSVSLWSLWESSVLPRFQPAPRAFTKRRSSPAFQRYAKSPPPTSSNSINTDTKRRRLPPRLRIGQLPVRRSNTQQTLFQRCIPAACSGRFHRRSPLPHGPLHPMNQPRSGLFVVVQRVIIGHGIQLFPAW